MWFVESYCRAELSAAASIYHPSDLVTSAIQAGGGNSSDSPRDGVSGAAIRSAPTFGGGTSPASLILPALRPKPLG